MNVQLADLDLGRAVLINGRPKPGGLGLFDVDDPSTGETLVAVSNGSVEDASAAVVAANDVLPRWRRTPPRERSEILNRAHQLMMRDADGLAAIIMAENGKSREDAAAEIRYAAEFFRWYAEEAVRGGGDYNPSPAGGARTIVTHRPVGVAVLVTPWNFPAAMATRKIAPALAAGCTVVLKPAAETPITAVAIARLLAEAGVPDGVVNLVPTTKASAVVNAWLQDTRVRKISFTGSTNVGRILLRQTANRVVNSSMELGGTAPFIVTADADIDAAVAGAMTAKFRNAGQACTAANSFHVHADVLDDFTTRLGAAVQSLTVGPATTGAQIGPLISSRAVEMVGTLVEAALAEGAYASFRAPLPDSRGHFYPPTVLSGVSADSTILSQEIFGPVAPIASWTDQDQLLDRLNSLETGLAGYVFAGRLQDAIRIGENLEVGMVGLNRGLVSDPSAPFGGVKQSGLGREGARYGLEEFQEPLYLSVDWPA